MVAALGLTGALACSSFSGDGDDPALAEEAGPPAEDAASADAVVRTDASPLGDAADAAADVVNADAADASMGCNGAVACERMVFVTSAIVEGHVINGVAGGDDFCTLLAATSQKPRVRGRLYKAWLSGGQDVATRLVQGTKPYVLANGTLLANDWVGFASSTHPAPISVDENGQPLAVNTETGVWTGSEPAGTTIANGVCGAWSLASAQGKFGRATENTIGWTNNGTAMCTTKLRLYCIER